MSKLVVVNTETSVPDSGRPAPEKILSGDPVHRTWNVESRDDDLYAGVWESTPGEWRVSYNEWEFCQILFGYSVLTEDGQSGRDLRPGDAVVIRPGFKGTWRVVETTRKTYVVRAYEPVGD